MWAFQDPPDTEVLISTDVLEDDAQVLAIVNNLRDGTWLFLSDLERSEDGDLVVERLDKVLHMDPTLSAFEDIPLAWVATRASLDDPWEHEATYPVDYDALMEFIFEITQEQQQQLQEDLQLGEWERWDLNQEDCTIVWSSGGEPKVRGTFQFVGSLSTDSNTWLWGWANESMLPQTVDLIEGLRDFGAQNALTRMTDPQWDAKEGDGWEMAGLACFLLDFEGVFRAPHPGGFAFVIIENLELLD